MLNKLANLTFSTEKVTEDIIMLKFSVVNAFLVGNKNDFVLVDTGVESSYDEILKTIEKYFGEGSQPKAIILTHGHFDHIGSVQKLQELWNVPVYAHKLEMPYLKGEKDYPKPDPSVDEGLVAKMSPSFFHEGIHLVNLRELSEGDEIPHMPHWHCVHTPGHTEGHISLFRETDQLLIVGDAFTTLKQESLLSVITQKEEINGPPKYLTTDYEMSLESIQKLKRLYPKIALPSHGKIIEGTDLMSHLDFLVNHFHEVAVPNESKFL